MVKPKTESTAVNELISLVASGGPSAPAPADDLFREPAAAVSPAMPRKRPHGTQPPVAPAALTLRGSGPITPPAPPRTTTSMAAATPPPVPTSRASIAVPPPPPSSRPSMSMAAATPPPVPTSRASIPLPVAQPTMASTISAAAVTYSEPAKVDMTDQSWFHDTRTAGRIEPPAGENWIGTTAISRQQAPRGLVRMMLLPAVIAAGVGVAVGAYFVVTNKHETHTASSSQSAPASESAPARVAANTPATDTTPTAATPSAPAADATISNVAANAAPAVAETGVPTTTARVALVDVRIDSKPAGATVTLVDRGKEMFLGTTPIVTSVDPSRTYEVVLDYRDHKQTEHLDPRATSRLDIALDAAASKEELAKAAKAEKLEQEKAAREAAKADKLAKAEAAKAEKLAKQEAAKAERLAKQDAAKQETAKPKHEAKAPHVAKVESATSEVPAAPKAEKAVAEPAGDGVLMIASKPPCEIYVDGKATGLMTPQRTISMTAGAHKITLVSPDKKYKKTVAVDITAGKPTKVIQDLMGAVE